MKQRFFSFLHSFLVSSIFLSPGLAWSGENFWKDYYTVKEQSVREITEAEWQSRVKTNPFSDLPLASDESITSFGNFLAIGGQVWDIIVKNRPVLESTHKNLSFLPKIINEAGESVPPHMTEMEGWDIPQVKHFQYSVKNRLGMTTIEFNYKIIYTAKGSYGGRGQYLTGIQVIPGELSVKWGYVFKAQTELVSAVNHGTVEDVVVGASLAVAMSFSTQLHEERASHLYHIKGDGSFSEL